MESFSYYNPVKIIFGEGQIAELAKEIPLDKRILMTYGGGSIKKNGVYDQVKTALQHHTLFEFAGIEPNPHYDTLMRAVEFCKTNKIDFLLAVGGGSVIDGTKFIAAAVNYVGDPWEILTENAPFCTALPIGTVLTLPAAGSEMNCGAVISRGTAKLAFMNEALFPKFSILDPTTTYSLPPKQISNGIIDAFVHVIEQYLTYPVAAPLQDRMAEGILQTLIELSPQALKHPINAEARATLMWAAAMALNGLIAVGVPEDWATHRIGHEITAEYGLDHGQTLAIILPGVMHVCREAKREKILQYAARIWNITTGDENARIDQAITKTREFFEALDTKIYLHDYAIQADCIPVITKRLEEHKLTALGEHGEVTPFTVAKILEFCL